MGEFHEGEAVERVGAASDARGISGTYRIIGSDYFRTLRLPMVRGREFSAVEEDSAQAPRVAIMDEALARRLFGSEDPLGQMIRFVERPGGMTKADNTPMEVVGVAAPIRDELFDREVRPSIYVPSGRNYRSTTHIHVRVTSQSGSGDPRQRSAASCARSISGAESCRSRRCRRSTIAVSGFGRCVQAGGCSAVRVLALLLAVVGSTRQVVRGRAAHARNRVSMAHRGEAGRGPRHDSEGGGGAVRRGVAIGLPLAAPSAAR